MLASLQDILDTVKANNLTYHQKLMTLGNIAERLFDPRDLLGYTDEEWGFLQNQMICDLCEGYAIYALAISCLITMCISKKAANF